MQTHTEIRSSNTPAAIIAGSTDSSDEITIAGKTYLTAPGLAKVLKISTRTLSRWDDRRKGPPRIKIGRLIVFDPDKIAGWLARNESNPEPQPRARRGG